MDPLVSSCQKLQSVHGHETMFRVTHTILKMIQEIISNPLDLKFRKIRVAAQIMLYTGTKDLLLTIGFNEDVSSQFLVYDMQHQVDELKQWKYRLIEYRKSVGHLDGWELPSKAISFSQLLGKGKFGEVYQGYFDDKQVAIKTLRSDSSQREKDEFKREGEIMSQMNHTNILQLIGTAFSMDVSSIVLELMHDSILKVLQQGSLSHKDILQRVIEVAAGMEYLHHRDILHCDLAARNILLNKVGTLKISDFGLSRYANTPDCDVKGFNIPFPIRWTAPEVLTSFILHKPADIWSFGILFYEFCTNGAVPYGSISNNETKSRVLSGYILPKPSDCPEEFHRIMQLCWRREPQHRPDFTTITATLLPVKLEIAMEEKKTQSDPFQAKTSNKEPKQSRSEKTANFKRAADYRIQETTLANILAKKDGGGLIRVHTLKVSDYDSRIVLPCKQKYTVFDIIVLILIKLGCGNQDPAACLLIEVQDNLLVPGERTINTRTLDHTEQPFHSKKGFYYLTPKTLKYEAADLIKHNSSKHNRTCGYLVKFDEKVSGYKQKAKDASLWHRIWCVLDGSTLLCYRNEDEESQTFCERYIDVAYCKVEEADSKKRCHVSRVTTKSGDSYLFQANTHDDVYRWMEALHYNMSESPSKVIHAMGEGEIKKGGEFGISLCQSQNTTEFGTQWTVLKTTGLMQYFYKSDAKQIGFVQECASIEIRNPTTNSPQFSIIVNTGSKVFTLKASSKGEHYEWGDTIYETLRDFGAADRLRGYSQANTKQGSDIYLRRKLSTRQGQGVKNDRVSSQQNADEDEPIRLSIILQEPGEMVFEGYSDKLVKMRNSNDNGNYTKKSVPTITISQDLERRNGNTRYPSPEGNSHSKASLPLLLEPKEIEASLLYETFSKAGSEFPHQPLPSDDPIRSLPSTIKIPPFKFYTKKGGFFSGILSRQRKHKRYAPESARAESPPPPPFPSSKLSFEEMVKIQKGDLPPPPEIETLRRTKGRKSCVLTHYNPIHIGIVTEENEPFPPPPMNLINLEEKTSLEVNNNDTDTDDGLASMLKGALKRMDHKKQKTVTEENGESPIETRNRINSENITAARRNYLTSEGETPTSPIIKDNEVKSAQGFSTKKAMLEQMFKKEIGAVVKSTECSVNQQNTCQDAQDETNAADDATKNRIVEKLRKQRELDAKAVQTTNFREKRTSTDVSQLGAMRKERLSSSGNLEEENAKQEFFNKLGNLKHVTPKKAVVPDASDSTQSLPIFDENKIKSKNSDAQLVTKLGQTNTTIPTTTTTTTTTIPTTTTTAAANSGTENRTPSTTTQTPLPPGWKSRQENGVSYYFNTCLGVSTWFLDDVLYLYEKSLEKPGDGWATYSAETGQKFYYNPTTKSRTWNIDDTKNKQ